MSKWSSAFRDSRWQKLRLQVMERDNWTCISCNKGKDDGTVLNVHHAYYESGKAPWEYPGEVLFTMCEECHTEYHNLQKQLQVTLLNTMAMCGDSGRSNSTVHRLIGFLHSESGPSIRNPNADYCSGYARGMTIVSDENAMKVTLHHGIDLIPASGVKHE